MYEGDSIANKAKKTSASAQAATANFRQLLMTREVVPRADLALECDRNRLESDVNAKAEPCEVAGIRPVNRLQASNPACLKDSPYVRG